MENTTSNSTPTLPYGVAPVGYRLPEATHIGRVRLQVADLERSIAYYERVLGLRVLRRNGSIAELAPQGDDAVLIELHEKSGIRPVARRGHIGLYHFAILLPDRAALGRFVAHLAALGVFAGMSDHFVSEAVYLQDPDGLGIEVYADRPRAAWRYEDRQLSMTTIPLNVPDLVASANGEAWDGAPAGTRIGHVHLYVRDIDDAARFYHESLGFDRSCGIIRARCSCPRAGTITILARTPGPRARRSRATMKRVSSSGSCSFRRRQTCNRRRAASSRMASPLTAMATTSSSAILGARSSESSATRNKLN